MDLNPLCVHARVCVPLERVKGRIYVLNFDGIRTFILRRVATTQRSDTETFLDTHGVIKSCTYHGGGGTCLAIPAETLHNSKSKTAHCELHTDHIIAILQAARDDVFWAG